MIETESHRDAEIVVEVGMGNEVTNGRALDHVFELYPFDQLFADANTRTRKSVRLAKPRRSVPKLKKRLARWQS